MLVTAKEMLEKARDGKYAVGHFNINNLEWTKAILQTAEELRSPVILGVSEGAGKYMTGFKTVVGMVNGMLEEMKITVPVALHLDHGTYEGCLKCIDAGFSSIMFDGSHYPIEENVEKTKELIRICREKGMSLEAEVGAIGGEEDGVIGMGECADPNECKMIADLGVDMLAAGIGNIHAWIFPAVYNLRTAGNLNTVSFFRSCFTAVRLNLGMAPAVKNITDSNLYGTCCRFWQAELLFKRGKKRIFNLFQ